MSTHPTFGEHIKDARVRAGLSLVEAAEKLSVSPAYLSRLENGACGSPSMDLLNAITSLYGGDKRIRELAATRELEGASGGIGPMTVNFDDHIGGHESHDLAHDHHTPMDAGTDADDGD